MSTPLRFRFAPSPTGVMHVGNLRTALFNKLAALHAGGVLILRIEDTDTARHDATAEAAILTGLTRLGLTWDEGPYRQSERGAVYADALDRLRGSGAVYPCFCTEAELEAERKRQAANGKPPRYAGTCRAIDADERAKRIADGIPFVWRFALTGGPVVFKDGVRGRVTFRPSELGDFPVARSDGSPLFLFASAVDDAAMGITDVIRGEDHLSNTPRQILLMRALGATPPRYHHAPIIVDETGKKLSKRRGAFDPVALLDEGYRPEAALTAVAMLGWAGIDGSTALPLAELAARFEIERVSKSPARYDAARVDHLNVALLKGEEGRGLLPFFAARGLAFGDADPRTVARCVADTIKHTGDILPMASMFAGRLAPDEESAAVLADESARRVVVAARAAVKGGIVDYDAVIESVKSATGAKGKNLFAPLRAALTGRLTGPNVTDLFTALGPGAILNRLTETTESWPS